MRLTSHDREVGALDLDADRSRDGCARARASPASSRACTRSTSMSSRFVAHVVFEGLLGRDRLRFAFRLDRGARSTPRARSRTSRPHDPKSSRSRASSSAAISPMVVMPKTLKRVCVFGPIPHRRPTGSGARNAASSPGRSRAIRRAYSASEAIFAIILPVATPALTVRPVARGRRRGSSPPRARVFERRRAERRRRLRPSRGLRRDRPCSKTAKISRETRRYFCMSGGTTTSCGQAVRAL